MTAPSYLDDLTARLAATDAYTAGIRVTVAAARATGALTTEPPLTLHAFDAAVRLWRASSPFSSLIAAALLRGDTGNAALIRACWPDLAATAQARYDAPGGRLAGERTDR